MFQKTEVNNATIVNSVTLGDIWGITDRRVRQLVNEGVIETVGRGKYDLFDCTRRYCTYLRAIADASDGKKAAKLNYDDEHAIHEKVKRETAELQLKVMRGELHRGNDVETIMTDMITRAKTKLLGIPSKAAPLVMGYNNTTKIESILQQQIDEALMELSDYKPKLFINDEVLQENSNDE